MAAHASHFGDGGGSVNGQSLRGGRDRAVAIRGTIVAGSGNNGLALGVGLLRPSLNLVHKSLTQTRLAETVAGTDKWCYCILHRVVEGIPNGVTVAVCTSISCAESRIDEKNGGVLAPAPRPLKIQTGFPLTPRARGGRRL